MVVTYGSGQWEVEALGRSPRACPPLYLAAKIIHMRKHEYEAYITSPIWSRRRTAFFSKHPKVCSACGSKEQIHLHHHTYDRIGGQELDADLVPLCQECHNLVHRYYSIGGKTLSVCTFEVIAWMTGQPVIRPNRVKKRMELAKAIQAPGRNNPLDSALGKIRDDRRIRLKEGAR